MRSVLLLAGLGLLVFGLIWMGQGAGYIMWPETSFMLQQTEWIYYGGATAILGAAIALYGMSHRK